MALKGQGDDGGRRVEGAGAAVTLHLGGEALRAERRGEGRGRDDARIVVQQDLLEGQLIRTAATPSRGARIPSTDALARQDGPDDGLRPGAGQLGVQPGMAAAGRGPLPGRGRATSLVAAGR